VAVKPVINRNMKLFEENKNVCSSCSRKNLPEPIVFAKLSRLSNKPVCDECYARDNRAIGSYGRRPSGIPGAR